MSDFTYEELQARVAELEGEIAQHKIVADAVRKITQENNAETAKFFKHVWDALVTEHGYATRTLWYMWKPGDGRDFAMTKPPSPEWAESCKKEGYFIAKFEIRVPDAAHITIPGSVRVEPLVP